jgi:hypothetical protein
MLPASSPAIGSDNIAEKFLLPCALQHPLRVQVPFNFERLVAVFCCRCCMRSSTSVISNPSSAASAEMCLLLQHL